MGKKKREKKAKKPSLPAADVPPAMVGQYQIGEKIGKGGFGTVYKALHAATAEIFAIKRMRITGMTEEQRNDLHVETKLLQKLHHVNIVQYIETIQTDSHLHIVLEFVEQGSLLDMVEKFQPFSEPICVMYISQVRSPRRSLSISHHPAPRLLRRRFLRWGPSAALGRGGRSALA